MDINNIGQGPARPIPAELETVEGFLQVVVGRHADFYKAAPDSEFRPMMVVLCENGDFVPILIADGFPTEESKDEFCAGMRRSFEVWGVKSYLMAMEAWMSSVSATVVNSDGTLDEKYRPSRQPDRIEVIVTVAVDRFGNKAQSCLKIERDQMGLVTGLVEVPDMEKMDFGGRFAEIFPPIEPLSSAVH